MCRPPSYGRVRRRACGPPHPASGRRWRPSVAPHVCFLTGAETRPLPAVSRAHPSRDAHPFNGPFSGTTRVGWYQKGKTNLDFAEARDSEWQWHQLGHMQVCSSLQVDNHASTSPLSFLQAGCPSCRPTNSVKALPRRRPIVQQCPTGGGDSTARRLRVDGRSTSPVALPPTVLSAQLPAMFIVRRQDGVPSSAGNGAGSGR